MSTCKFTISDLVGVQKDKTSIIQQRNPDQSEILLFMKDAELNFEGSLQTKPEISGGLKQVETRERQSGLAGKCPSRWERVRSHSVGKTVATWKVVKNSLGMNRQELGE